MSVPSFDLPCAGVKLDSALLRRARALARAHAARQGREAGVSRGGAQAGYEFERYQPYYPGADPRAIDWDLAARDDEHWQLRVRRPEDGARWQIFLDDSASMGLGPPGKLQAAAECALALAWLARARGARAELWSVHSTPLVFESAASASALLLWLEALRAQGTLADTAVHSVLAHGRRAQRVFLLSDFSAPDPLAWLASRARGARWNCLRLLAPSELEAPQHGLQRFVDPESGEERRVELNPQQAQAYAERQRNFSTRWQAQCARARVHAHTLSSAASLEQRFECALGA